MADRNAYCTNCEQTVKVEWTLGRWQYAEHKQSTPIGVAVKNGKAVGVAVKDSTCPNSKSALPPGVFTATHSIEELER